MIRQVVKKKNNNKFLYLFIRVHQETIEVVIISISWFYTGCKAGIFF
jgi:hypothetical protein